MDFLNNLLLKEVVSNSEMENQFADLGIKRKTEMLKLSIQAMQRNVFKFLLLRMIFLK